MQFRTGGGCSAHRRCVVSAERAPRSRTGVAHPLLEFAVVEVTEEATASAFFSLRLSRGVR
ncbi:hypothetical protein [Haloplanus sp. GCM10025708]|uniref:hypothetical protein n=1 Tax=Haloplanus sp. GCM10025708 TaxID=3252679 RepID=UPI0036D3E349